MFIIGKPFADKEYSLSGIVLSNYSSHLFITISDPILHKCLNLT
ncbi:MAG: hypothetical protein ACJAR1_002387 [Rubritalea sp.]|jgi:hypothetical protein